MLLVFCLGAAFFAYTYFGYPALLITLRRLAADRPAPAAPATPPNVAIVVIARNEEGNIRQKLQDLLEQDYPADRLEIWVASDASTDGTNAIVEALSADESRVLLLASESNGGKAEMVNLSVARVTAEIIVFADARQRLARDAVSRLAAHFADARVGIVGGEMAIVAEDGSASHDATGLYWRYETAIRRTEAKLGLLTGVSGALYAMRRALFRQLPRGIHCEDVMQPLNVRDQGFEVHWEPAARFFETQREDGTEYKRKVRTLVGNYELMRHMWRMYMPWKGRTAFVLWSHKVFRLLIPLALIALLVSSATLASAHWLFALALVGQLILYGCGALGLLWPKARKARLINVCATFLMLNTAAFHAMLHVMIRGPHISWR